MREKYETCYRTIKDINWTFRLLPRDEYKAKHGDDSQGLTNKTDRFVDFDESKFTLKLVKHELVHVYSASCCITDCNDLTHEDMEEVLATAFEEHAEQLLLHAESIYKHLRRLKDEC